LEVKSKKSMLNLDDNKSKKTNKSVKNDEIKSKKANDVEIDEIKSKKSHL